MADMLHITNLPNSSNFSLHSPLSLPSSLSPHLNSSFIRFAPLRRRQFSPSSVLAKFSSSNSSQIDIISRTELSDGSVSFKFGDASEIDETVEDFVGENEVELEKESGHGLAREDNVVADDESDSTKAEDIVVNSDELKEIADENNDGIVDFQSDVEICENSVEGETNSGLISTKEVENLSDFDAERRENQVGNDGIAMSDSSVEVMIEKVGELSEAIEESDDDQLDHGGDELSDIGGMSLEVEPSSVEVSLEIEIEKDKIVEDETMKDEIVEDKIVNDEIMEEQIVKDEIVEDEVVLFENEIVKDEIVKDEFVSIEDGIVKDEIVKNEVLSLKNEIVKEDEVYSLEDESAEDEIVKDETADDENVKDDIVKDEVVSLEDEIVPLEGEIVKYEISKDEMLSLEDEIVKDEIAENEIVKDVIAKDENMKDEMVEDLFVSLEDETAEDMEVSLEDETDEDMEVSLEDVVEDDMVSLENEVENDRVSLENEVEVASSVLAISDPILMDENDDSVELMSKKLEAEPFLDEEMNFHSLDDVVVLGSSLGSNKVDVASPPTVSQSDDFQYCSGSSHAAGPGPELSGVASAEVSLHSAHISTFGNSMTSAAASSPDSSEVHDAATHTIAHYDDETNILVAAGPVTSGIISSESGLDSLNKVETTAPAFSISSSVATLAHFHEALTGGKDAYFVSENWFGVADGVGQWSLGGVDIGLYAHELMQNCEKLLKSMRAELTNAKELLKQSVAMTKSTGSARVLIALVANQVLHVANIGDSGFVIIRNGTVFQKSSPMVHEFSFPYAIGLGDDSVEDVEEYNIELEDGDVIITATDGLFDNLYEQEIASIVSKAVEAGMSLQDLAELLAIKAEQVGRSGSARSPFADAAQAAGHPGYSGGKLDHVTVIVSLVQR